MMGAAWRVHPGCRQRPTFRSQCPPVCAPGTERLGPEKRRKERFIRGRGEKEEPRFCQWGVPGQGKTLEVTGAFGTPLGDPTAWASDGQVTPTTGSRQQDSQWPGCQGEGGGTKRTSTATPAADGGGGEGRSR